MDIVIKNLTKSFGEKICFTNKNIIFKENSYNIITGPSGCGKTTLLRIIMGFEKADEGTIEGVPKKISAIFQEDRLCESSSALDNVLLVTKSDTKNKELAINHLNKLGLEDSIHLPVSKLSGGMKRRVAIARALMADYELLIADEPFKGLDEKTKEKVIRYFIETTSGKTVILVTHDKEEVEMFDGEGCFNTDIHN